MSTTDMLEEIRAKQHELAELVRMYCRSQRELWQQIPWLALQADGRSGFTDEAARRYNWGLLSLRSGNFSGFYHYFVDLESGEIVGDPELLKPLPDGTILKIEPAELDASAIMAGLKKQCKEPDGRASKNPEEVARWRTVIAEHNGLAAGKPYQRLRPNKISWSLD